MIYAFGECALDVARRELYHGDHLVAIEPKMFEVLLYLLEHRDRVVSKEELFAQCWPDTFVTEAALTRCLTKLRKVVHGGPHGSSVIKTVHRQGYCFVATVTTSPQAPAAPGHGAAAEPPVPLRFKILIVDDEPFNVDLLEQELADLGYETISARDGQEALDKVATVVPDLILLDVMMPIMDGFTVCRMLKDNDETRLIPIVIMTALGAAEDRIKGIEAGADDFLTKPVNPKELFARVHTASSSSTRWTGNLTSYVGSRATLSTWCSLSPSPRCEL